MKFTFAHNNLNVLDLDKSLAFYREALGLEVAREKEASDHSFKLVYLSDGTTPHQLELTGFGTAPSPTTWGTTRSTWPLWWRTLTPLTPCMRRWAASATRTPAWASTSSATRTATGWRSSRSGKHVPPCPRIACTTRM